jgi:Nucleoside diphosphate kinase
VCGAARATIDPETALDEGGGSTRSERALDDQILVDPDLRIGDATLRQAVGSRTESSVSRIGAILFTPACLVAGRLADGLSYLQGAGFTVTALRRVQLAEDQVRRIWRFQAEQFTAERWDVAVRLFCAGPSLLVMVHAGEQLGRSTAQRLKDLQGPSDPDLLEDDHLRACLRACNKVNNLVHVPQTPPALLREVAIIVAPQGLPALWRTATLARPLPDLEYVADALAGAGRPGAVCVVRNALRLRWRALLAAEGLAGEPPTAVRDVLRAGAQWIAGQPDAEGAEVLRRWRWEIGDDRFGHSLCDWLEADQPLCRAMLSVDAVLLGQSVSVRTLERDLSASGIAVGQWELLSLLTEVVSQDALRCA